MELRIDVPYRNILRSLHQSRCDFVRMLPRAHRILDLGGTDQAEDAGALVSMGYPYRVRAAHDHRPARRAIATNSTGTWRRRRRSVPAADRCSTGITRWSTSRRIPTASFDLVFSGQTIEHITEDEARKMLAEVRRVLVPGGWFCLDTPNRRVTAMQLGPDVLSNPDHKLEYTHAHLSELLRDAGLRRGRCVRTQPRRRVTLDRRVRHRGGRGQARRVRRDRGLLLPRVHVPAGRRAPRPLDEGRVAVDDVVPAVAAVDEALAGAPEGGTQRTATR